MLYTAEINRGGAANQQQNFRVEAQTVCMWTWSLMAPRSLWSAIVCSDSRISVLLEQEETVFGQEGGVKEWHEGKMYRLRVSWAKIFLFERESDGIRCFGARIIATVSVALYFPVGFNSESETPPQTFMNSHQQFSANSSLGTIKISQQDKV